MKTPAQLCHWLMGWSVRWEQNREHCSRSVKAHGASATCTWWAGLVLRAQKWCRGTGRGLGEISRGNKGQDWPPRSAGLLVGSVKQVYKVRSGTLGWGWLSSPLPPWRFGEPNPGSRQKASGSRRKLPYPVCKSCRLWDVGSATKCSRRLYMGSPGFWRG